MFRFKSALKNHEVVLHAIGSALASGAVVLTVSLVVDVICQLFLDASERAYMLLADDLLVAAIVVAICFVRGMLVHRQKCLTNAYILSKRAREFQIKECLHNIAVSTRDQFVLSQVRSINTLLGGETSSVPISNSRVVAKMKIGAGA